MRQYRPRRRRVIGTGARRHPIALALVILAGCIEGSPEPELRACETAADCPLNDPCQPNICEAGVCTPAALDPQLGGGDLDQDDRCDAGDEDDDGDEIPDLEDACPREPSTPATDWDSDGCADSQDGDPTGDPDNDNDGIVNEDDACDYSERGFVSSADTDYDGDGCEDAAGVVDSDRDGLRNGVDRCPLSMVPPTDDGPWRAGGLDDLDGDGCHDDLEDEDDDQDGVPDVIDGCVIWVPGWVSTPNTDYDGDGCADDSLDDDDDGDGIVDALDECRLGPPNVPATAESDFDQDGCIDAIEDDDDDGDGVDDAVDGCSETPAFTALGLPISDRDGDGCHDEIDLDVDGDGVPNVDDDCDDSDVGFVSYQATDFDGDGCANSADLDDDNDGVEDPVDRCLSITNAPDTDRDGCANPEDDDDDNDGVADGVDNCPLRAPVEGDYDGDGCGDAVDPDVDGDLVPNALDACRGAPGRIATPAVDRDGDGCIDGREDDDDDNDGRPDRDDACPLGEIGWDSFDRALDGDQDGCLDEPADGGAGLGEDLDDDADGAPDDEDCAPNNPNRGPNQLELCDQVDNDCDESVDEGTQQVLYHDDDGDEFGDPTRPTLACAGDPDLVADGTDCDDDDPTRNPAAGCDPPPGLRDGTWHGVMGHYEGDAFITDCALRLDIDELDADGDGQTLSGRYDCDDLDPNDGSISGTLTDRCDPSADDRPGELESDAGLAFDGMALTVCVDGMFFGTFSGTFVSDTEFYALAELDAPDEGPIPRLVEGVRQ